VEIMSQSQEPLLLPIVPLRDMVVFPHMMAPFVVGRKPSVVALERALERPDKKIFLATQRDPKIDEPAEDDVYPLGVVARVVQHLQLASGNIKVMVEGLQRARIVELAPSSSCLMARVEQIAVTAESTGAVTQYMGELTEQFKEYAKLSHHLSAEGVLASLQTDDAGQFADILAAHLNQPTADKQLLLEIVEPLNRLEKLNDILDVEIEKLNIDRRISSRGGAPAAQGTGGRVGHDRGGPGKGADRNPALGGDASGLGGGRCLPQLRRLAPGGAVDQGLA
jgi:ATP-dependent Lon protease